MEQEKKDGNYSLNTFKDIWKYDRARLLDLGNIAQVLISQNKPEIDEESRALSNFEKLTEDIPRPISHTLVDASRILPDIITLATGPAIATGKKAYFVGKPNPLMLRHGLKKIGCHSEDIAFIGDRMDTDIIAAIESNIDSILVLSGVTKNEDIDLFPYRPKYVIDGVGDIVKNIVKN